MLETHREKATYSVREVKLLHYVSFLHADKHTERCQASGQVGSFDCFIDRLFVCLFVCV